MRARGTLLTVLGHEAVKKGDLVGVEAQLALNPALRDAKDDMGRLPFHWAVMEDDPNLWSLTFSRAALEATDSRGITPLLLSITNKSPAALKWLLERSVSVNSVRGTDPLDPTPLHWAAAQRRAEHVSLLLAHGASASATNLTGSTPLHRAAKMGATEVARLLLQAGANPDAGNAIGATPLIFASANDHPELVAVLLKGGAEPSLRDRHGKSALDYAMENDNPEVVEILRRALPH